MDRERDRKREREREIESEKDEELLLNAEGHCTFRKRMRDTE